MLLKIDSSFSSLSSTRLTSIKDKLSFWKTVLTIFENTFLVLLNSLRCNLKRESLYFYLPLWKALYESPVMGTLSFMQKSATIQGHTPFSDICSLIYTTFE